MFDITEGRYNLYLMRLRHACYMSTIFSFCSLLWFFLPFRSATRKDVFTSVINWTTAPDSRLTGSDYFHKKAVNCWCSLKQDIDLIMMTSSNGNIIFVLLALCTGNSPVTGEFPSQRPMTRRFDVSFDLCLNKRLTKQSWDETGDLRRYLAHCDAD